MSDTEAVKRAEDVFAWQREYDAAKRDVPIDYLYVAKVTMEAIADGADVIPNVLLAIAAGQVAQADRMDRQLKALDKIVVNLKRIWEQVK